MWPISYKNRTKPLSGQAVEHRSFPSSPRRISATYWLCKDLCFSQLNPIVPLLLRSRGLRLCSGRELVQRFPSRGSQVRNACPFPALKAGFSPYVRLSSRRSLLTLGGAPPLPRMSLRDNGVYSMLRKLLLEQHQWLGSNPAEGCVLMQRILNMPDGQRSHLQC
jgi:hypothetical protein